MTRNRIIIVFGLTLGLFTGPVAGEDEQQVEAETRSDTPGQVHLDSSAVTGNRELPKVLYIVPWQAAAAGKVSGRPVNSLVDELLSPVDRDTFSRELRYHAQLEGEAESTLDADSEE